MQNDPLQGNANPNSMNHPAHLVAAEEADRYTKADPDSEVKNEDEKEQDTKPEDFENFNIDKVDDLNKVKEEDVDHK
ncbi:hypothetical protein VXN63_00890 [Marinilactibacillus sp. XAAS-LB27]|uniref:hypothetical protein n=1 Tax=Marinilactibacillus sp. XAAS-LB27 TaxID=3114538 RepID=UPI002E1839F6|nr:hypothetical protein [Marinilactibacillus sp. XAAS-LB27]